MTTNSARPDLLAQFSADLARRTRSASTTLDRVTTAFAAYRASCPDGLALSRPDLEGHQVLSRTAALATGVDQIGAAFTRADSQGGSTVATASDLALSDAIVAVAPGLFGGALAEPRRASLDLARRTGQDIGRFADDGQWAEAQEWLRRLPDEATADPQFGAALFAELTPQQVDALAGGLFAYGQGQGTETGAGIRRFSRLHNAATRLWATQMSGTEHPGSALHRALSQGGGGRDTLRRLFLTSKLTPSSEVLAPVVVPLYSFEGFDHAYSRDEVTRFFDERLHSGALSGDAHSTTRWEVMNGLVTVAAKNPRGAGQPLATVLAESVFDDQAFWVIRSRRGMPSDQAEITSSFEAIARHDESFLTLVAGLEVRQRQYLAGAVAPSPTVDIDELDDLDALATRLATAAERADGPGDPWSWAFTAVDAGLDVAQTAVPVGGKAAKIVLRPLVDAGLDQWHQGTIPEPGTKEAQVQRQRARRRANAWAAVATEPTLAGRLDMTVGDGEPMSIDVLRALATAPDAVTALGAWEAGQPDDLVALVDDLAGGR